MSDKNKRLGMGLSELLGEDQNISDAVDEKFLETNTVSVLDKFRFLPIDSIIPCRNQPRKAFDENHLAELSESIKEKGILQPILVRWLEHKNIYEIIAGERRWRASQKIGLHEIPAIISSASDQEVLENSIIENIQREDLNPLEIANALKKLIEEFNYTHDKVSEIIHKSRSHISNLMRLCNAPSNIVEALLAEKITLGHAKVLLNFDDSQELLEITIKKELSVRALEEYIKKIKNKSQRLPYSKDQDTIILENDLTNALGIKVKINHKSDKTGFISLHYQSIEQLDEICKRLCNEVEE